MTHSTIQNLIVLTLNASVMKPSLQDLITHICPLERGQGIALVRHIYTLVCFTFSEICLNWYIRLLEEFSVLPSFILNTDTSLLHGKYQLEHAQYIYNTNLKFKLNMCITMLVGSIIFKQNLKDSDFGV